MKSDEPSLLPSNQPSSFPTDLPSIKHSSAPSVEASITPSIVRSDGPSLMPSNSPSSSPSEMRSDRPSLLPSNLPTKMRSDEPSLLPSNQPSSSPSLLRSDGPSSLPTNQPTKMRSDEPSLLPSNLPSSFPSSTPSVEASITPSIVRSDGPSYSPSSTPSVEESSLPSLLPSMDPSNLPTKMRSDEPSLLPSVSPSVKESSAPSLTSSSIPTLVSSNKPSVSSSPTTRYVCPAMSVEYNLCLQRGNYQNKYDEVGNVTFAVSTVNNEYVWELRIEDFVDDIVGKNILRQDTLENIKAYVGSSAPSSNAGSYNYKFTDRLPYANDADLIAFGGLSCDNDLYFGVHLDADTGDTIWAIPCSDGRSADVPYEQFTEGWGGYSSYSSIDCHECNDLLLENSIFRRRLFSDETDNIHSQNIADFECLFEENDISCPYCLSCLGQCDDECGFYSYPSEEDLLSCLENMIPECSDKCSDVCNGHFIDHIFASSSEDDNAFNMNPYDSSNHSTASSTSTHSSSEMICSAQDMNQNACPYCDTCLAACDDECGFYTSASVEEWATCFENLSDECVDMCKDVCRKEFSIEVK